MTTQLLKEIRARAEETLRDGMCPAQQLALATDALHLLECLAGQRQRAKGVVEALVNKLAEARAINEVLEEQRRLAAEAGVIAEADLKKVHDRASAMYAELLLAGVKLKRARATIDTLTKEIDDFDRSACEAWDLTNETLRERDATIERLEKELEATR